MAAKNPIDMGEADVAYLQGGRKPLTTASSILISSSKYLNSGRMREVYAALGLQRTGHDLPEAYLVPEFSAALNELTDWPQLFRLIEHERRAKPEFAAWLDARFVSDMKPAGVAHCAPGTLGAHVYEFMTGSGFTLDFAFREAPGNDYEYFIKRRVQSHDIEHMVTGFESTPLGEYGLMIFTAVSNAIYFSEALAHEINRHGMLLFATGLSRAALHYPRVATEMLLMLDRATVMGKRVNQPLFYVKWEDHFDRTMEQIRDDLGIVDALPRGAWDWSNEAFRG